MSTTFQARPVACLALAALLVAGCTSMHAPAPAPQAQAPAEPEKPAGPKPMAEAVFEDAAPAALAPRLASACTRQRMALIQNTPEQVVCRRESVVTSDSPRKMVAELWTFVLQPTGDGMSTKVEGHSALEGASSKGYARVGLAEQSQEGSAAMLAFLEEVRGLQGLRGRFGARMGG